MTQATIKRILGVVGALGVLLGALVLVRATTSTSSAHEYHAVFDNVKGLVTYADVTLAGAKIGQVSRIGLSPDGEHADVTIALDRDVHLKSDALLQLRIKSLLGELYLSLDPGRAAAPLTGETIRHTGTDLSLDDLLYSLSGLLGDVADSHQVRDLVQQLTVAFQNRGTDVTAVMSDTQVLTSALADRSETLGRIVVNLDTLTQSLDGRSTAVGDVIHSSAVTIAQLRRTIAQNAETIQSTIATLQATLQRVSGPQLSDALATIPGWIEKIDFVINQLQALTGGKSAVAAYFVSLPDMNNSIDALFRNIATNPLLKPVREMLIAQMQADLRSQNPKPGQAVAKGPGG